jgi:hypothetical protein
VNVILLINVCYCIFCAPTRSLATYVQVARFDISPLMLLRIGVFRDVTLCKRDEVTGEWRKLHNEELNGLYSLPNIVRVKKSRRM